LFEHSFLVNCNLAQQIYFFNNFPAFGKVKLLLNAHFSIQFESFTFYLCVILVVKPIVLEVMAYRCD